MKTNRRAALLILASSLLISACGKANEKKPSLSSETSTTSQQRSSSRQTASSPSSEEPLLTHRVSLPQGEGYSFAPSAGYDASAIPDGGAFEFDLTLEEGYTQGRDLEVKAGEETLSPVSKGHYRIEEVTSDLAVRCTLSKNVYTVTYPAETAGYSLSGEDGAALPSSLIHGESLSFSLNVEEGYTQKRNLQVTANGTALAEEEGFYRVGEVKENLVIAVSLDLNSYTITYHTQSASGPQTSTKQALHGEMVDLAEGEGYSSGDFSYAFAGWYEAEEGGEAVHAITASQDLDLYAHYDAALPVSFSYDANAVEVVYEGGEAVKNGNVAVGSTVKFRVTPKSGYDQEGNVTVRQGDEPLTADGEGYYNVLVEGSSIRISIAAKKNTYAVSFQNNGIEGASFAGVNGDLPSSVEYGSTLSFQAVLPERNDYYYVVKVNGAKISPQGDGTYQIADVREAKHIEIARETILDRLYDPAYTWDYFRYGTAPSIGTNSLSFADTKVTATAKLFQDAVAQGYTHLKVHWAHASQGSAAAMTFTHGGTWNKYWRQRTSDFDLRINLAQMVDDAGNFVTGSLSAEGGMVLSDFSFYRDENSANYAYSGTNVYCCQEGEDLVIDTISAGNDSWVAPKGWADFFQSNGMSFFVKLKYEDKGSNTRTPVVGFNGSAVTAMDLASLEADEEGYSLFNMGGPNVFTEKRDVSANPLSLGLDKEGVVAIRRSDVSVPNAEAKISFASPAADGARSATLIPAASEENYYIDMHGHTGIEVTFSCAEAAKNIWYGNAEWGGGGMFALDLDQVSEPTAEGKYEKTVRLEAGKLTYAKGFNVLLKAAIASGSVDLRWTYLG